MEIDVRKFDVVIVGAGLAGCAAARECIKGGLKTAILTKVHPLRSHSCAAQGGVNAALSEEDTTLHAKDTIVGGDYLCDQEAVEFMCKHAPETIRWAERMGAVFSRTEDGKIAQRAFGGQSFPRACYAKDRVGLTLLQTIYEQARREGVEFFDEWYVSDLMYRNGKINGVFAYNIRDSRPAIFNSRITMFATGGYARAYKINSNAIANTGDGLSIVARLGLPLEDMEFVQFHPTGLAGTGILISEAARGEGGRLFNSKNERFMEKYAPDSMELAPRDVVGRAIIQEVLKGNGVGKHKDAVYLDLTHLGSEKIMQTMPELHDLALSFLGLDMTKEPILIQPTAHYSMGGIPVDINGRVKKSTTEFTEGFYAAGECACISVHGANRLGANSVLEALLFGRHVGKQIVQDIPNISFHSVHSLEGMKAYTDVQSLMIQSGQEKINFIVDELQKSMSENAGIYRTKEGLERQLLIIDNLKSRYKNIAIRDKSNIYNSELQEVIELGHMLDYAKFIVSCALARCESRGAHFREDFPDRNDDTFLKHSYAYMGEDGAISVEFADVDLCKLNPKQRNY